MQKIIGHRSLILIAAAACLSTAAQADVITENLFGTVTGGTDTTGLFGPAGTDFSTTNESFQIVLEIDATAFGTAYSMHEGTFGNQRCCYAAFDDTAGDDAESLSVTIDGQMYAVTSSASGDFSIGNPGVGDDLNVSTTDTSGDVISASFTGSSTFAEFNGSVPAVIDETPGFFAAPYSLSSLTVDGESLTVSDLSSATPEPSSAALMLLGGTALGFGLYRRKRASLA